jgi:hypothetical protein
MSKSGAQAGPPRLIAFLPWLRLAKTTTVKGVDFIPLATRDGAISAELGNLSTSLRKILSSYVDLEGRAMSNCVVACMPGRTPAWNLTDGDFDAVRSAASLLALASIAENHYFGALGSYCNSSTFAVYWQRFTEPAEWIAVVTRRRDGTTQMGGYRHGEVRFTVPVQCHALEKGSVNEDLLAAVNWGHAQGSQVMARLESALSFFLLASTDAEAMAREGEIILMASAFEQLLKGNASAYKLARKFGVLFRRCGSVTVADAMRTRSKIWLDPDPTRKAAQLNWHVHKKWIEELYDRRSKYVHGGSLGARTWAWSDAEHSVVAAFVFPLAVKLLLMREGHPTLTEDEAVRCQSIDKLLAATEWHAVVGHHSDATTWRTILDACRRDIDARGAVAAAVQEYERLKHKS